MPREVFGADYPFLPRKEILDFEEIARLASVFTGLGVKKLRLTGGEPLLRRNIERLVAMLAAIPGIEDIAMTTNGSLLTEKVGLLQEAGLGRLTVSLDSLDESTFHAMTDARYSSANVVAGIEAAVALGFAPVKINMVVKRGVNDRDIVPMALRFGGPNYILRYIEYMDVGNTNGWKMDDVVPADEIVDRLDRAIGLTRLPAHYASEVARRYRTRDGGEIGLITSVTHPFCRACSRARLSADGHLYTCLFAGEGHDLRGPLRSGATDNELAERLRAIWSKRNDRYSEERTAAGGARPKAEMSLLGG
jgi:cyclic pyranopterin phosphate synthase